MSLLIDTSKIFNKIQHLFSIEKKIKNLGVGSNLLQDPMTIIDNITLNNKRLNALLLTLCTKEGCSHDCVQCVLEYLPNEIRKEKGMKSIQIGKKE